ncbi:MAG: hypothetical protein V4670_11875 [Bacteroidota bacterium]
MHEFIQKFHSGWAYIALILLVFAILNSVMGLTSNREFTAKDRKIALFGLIAAHIQLLVGLILYFVSQKGLAGFDMKNAEMRETSLEHPLMVLLGIVLITIGWSKHKKLAESQAKFKKIAVMYGLGLVLILSRLPWSSWLA